MRLQLARYEWLTAVLLKIQVDWCKITNVSRIVVPSFMALDVLEE
jgi:hypothetical protein